MSQFRMSKIPRHRWNTHQDESYYSEGVVLGIYEYKKESDAIQTYPVQVSVCQRSKWLTTLGVGENLLGDT